MCFAEPRAKKQVHASAAELFYYLSLCVCVKESRKGPRSRKFDAVCGAVSKYTCFNLSVYSRICINYLYVFLL